jgi:hypothetical protein
MSISACRRLTACLRGLLLLMPAWPAPRSVRGLAGDLRRAEGLALAIMVLAAGATLIAARARPPA